MPWQTITRGLPELLEHPIADSGQRSLAEKYVAALQQRGTSALISNAASTTFLLCDGPHKLPVTVDDGTFGRTYVTSPHSAYVLYGKQEVALLGLGHLKYAANAVLGALDALIRAIGLNRAVHLDNWLLSTNLHGDWKGEGLAAMRALLSARYPEHCVILRSLDSWTCPDLLAAARNDGWTLLPSRQVWVTDDLKLSWRPRNQTRNDYRALQRSGLTIEQPTLLNLADCERISQLYHQLYVGRYSDINPIFTPQFISISAQIGLLNYCVVRNCEGIILAVAGLRCAGGVGTVPLIGYDTSRPQDEALYRIASFLAADLAMTKGLRFNGSSGASQFKRQRGAHGVIEYMAVDARHLPAHRRAGLAVLSAALNKFMVPMLEKQGW